MLARHGWRKLAPDTEHPQGDAGVREDWKKTPQYAGRNASPLEKRAPVAPDVSG
jgi:hypothetical protein